jgi:hypothetical protein
VIAITPEGETLLRQFLAMTGGASDGRPGLICCRDSWADALMIDLSGRAYQSKKVTEVEVRQAVRRLLKDATPMFIPQPPKVAKPAKQSKPEEGQTE